MKILLSLLIAICMMQQAVRSQDADAASEAPKTEVGLFSEPFDLSTATLPVGFPGHSFEEIFNGLAKNFIQKSEFETTVAYKERMRKGKEVPYWQKLKVSDTLAFMVNPEGVKTGYDADRQMMTLSHWVRELDNSFGTYKQLPLGFKETDLGSYVGENAYGVKKDIAKLHRTETQVAFSDKNLREFRFKSSPYSTDFLIPFAMSSKDAEAKPNLRLLAICNLLEPYGGQSKSHSTPTIRHPIDVETDTYYILVSLKEFWVYDQDSGKIYAKIQSPRTKRK